MIDRAEVEDLLRRSGVPDENLEMGTMMVVDLITAAARVPARVMVQVFD